MTRSMTGFARASATWDGGSLAWEIRSVNHRYVEATFKLPEAFREIEPALRDATRGRIHRGKLDCVLKVDDGDTMSALDIDDSQLMAIKRFLDRAATALDRPLAINPLELLKLPGVAITVEKDQKLANAAAQSCFHDALGALIDMREREGAELHAVIEDRLDKVHGVIDGVKAAEPLIAEQLRTRLMDRFSQMEAEVDPARLEQEFALLVQKADVGEEIDRIEAHIQETRAALASEGGIGRRLDFLMQEFNREANTLASKASAISTSLDSVELKVLIEQMREQIQNIE